MSEEERRRRYLQLMGIQSWRLQRHGADPKLSEPLEELASAPLAPAASGVAAPHAATAKGEGDLSAPAPLPPSQDRAPVLGAVEGGAPRAVASAVEEESSSPLAQQGGLDLTPDQEAESGVSSMGWDELIPAICGCRACPLHATRTQAVPGVGHRQAQWLIVGEAPGADEDRLGEPFVGRSGRLLDRMLFALQLAREQVFIANVVKCRPPNNRDPAPAEIAACQPYLWRQIALLEPRIILVVGRVAAQTLLRTTQPIGRLRGRVHRFGAAATPLVVTYHPAYLLRSPGEKRKAWEDLCLARQTLAERALLQGQRAAAP